MEKLKKLKQKFENKKAQRHKNNENQENKKPHFSRAWKAVTILILLLIIYTGYHVFFGLSEKVRTTAAGLVEQSTSVMLEGVIFRNEEPIKTANRGDMRPYYTNGERVSVDSVVAAVYSDCAGTDINAKIEVVKEKIEIYERSNIKGLVSIVDIETLQGEIDKLYTSLMLAISNNENYKVKAIEKELTICLNKMKIYRGEVKSYSAEIESLKAELEELYDSFVGEEEYIYADNGGYFYHTVDGYEDILAYENISTLTPDTVKGFISQTKEKSKISSQYTCKFVYNSTWYLVSYCDDATASLLEVDKEYTVTLFDIKERILKVTLEQIGESQNGEHILIFSCSTMPEGFDYSRYQIFKLDISSVEGYRVPKEALVTVVDEQSGEKKMGVYILSASVVHFRRVNTETMIECDGYYIVEKLDKTKENYYEYLDLNDIIILEPDGMYEGKILTK